MLFGDNSLVRGNVVYDLDRMAVDSTEPNVYANAVGGAEGIFVGGSNNEVSYNQFINCKAEASWVSQGDQGDQVGYDGGATEVSVPEGDTVSNLRVHHNLAYNTCGFFEVSGFGTFADSEFYCNVSVDSSWAMLLQVNETTLSNIRWKNNTFVHHADAYSPSIAMIYQADLTPGTVFFDNNVVIFDGAPMYMGTLDAAISASNNLIVDYDPGVANLAGIQPQDFDLIAGGEAIDQGLTVAGHTLDFLNRVVPDAAGATDIGAFEYGSTQGEEQPDLGMEGTTGSGAADSGAGGSSTGVGGASAGVGGSDVEPSCTSPLVLCGALCVDLASDASNCGQRGSVCPTGQLCSGGGCSSACEPGTVQCGQSCVDTESNVLHCGGCDVQCGGGQVCTAGVCTGASTCADATQPIQPPSTANAEADSAEEESGCACTVVGTHGPGHPARPELALLGAAVLVVWRRRRTGRSSRNH